MITTLFKLATEVAAKFCDVLYRPSVVITFSVVMLVFVGIIFAYGATVYSLCAGRARSSTIKALRIRLLLLCT